MPTQQAIPLEGTPFLDRVPRESREQILVNSTRIRYPAGTIAFQPGDADRADILESGLARLYLTSAEGRQTTIRYAHPGELMGGLLVMGAAFALGTALSRRAPPVPDLALAAVRLARAPVGPIAPVDDHGHVRVVLVVLDHLVVQLAG